ncbi:MAG: dTMP kinase [Candidatus Omnitrophica bacterium]|nr:dTMP kinase [Candidatus Omnitrophota bacterium]
MKTLKKGLFITFEGTEGSGKSTQSKMLTSFLRRKGFKVLHIWDPGSTKLGESIRKTLLTPGQVISHSSEMLLYMAARAQLVEEKILPALKNNFIVICDRFIDATVTYQGYGLGVDIKMIENLNKFVTKSISPSVTIFLDANVKKGLKRSRRVKGFSDRIERRTYSFHKRVRDGYIALAKRFRNRIKTIPVEENTKDETQSIIRSIVLDAIKRHKRPK